MSHLVTILPSQVLWKIVAYHRLQRRISSTVHQNRIIHFGVKVEQLN